MSRRTTRREFLRQSALGGFSVLVGARLAGARPYPPSERLGIGVVGVANRGSANLAAVSSEEIVALCDIDDKYLAAAARNHPRAQIYNDFRRMLDRKDIDAVVVSTPDHTHAPATNLALKAGKHVYCEKPLTHTVYEARVVRETAKRLGRVTQMGTQIHAGSNYRRVVELVETGAVGEIREVHVWVGGKPWHGGERPKETPPVPPHIHWDLWLGPAPYRPYHPVYLPANWRRWWDFGGGTLADMACHYMDLPHWALKLREPVSVEAEGPPVHPETTPFGLVVRWEYPARGKLPPVKLTWYDGDKRPPHIAEGKIPAWGSGVLFVGSKGLLLADYTRRKLLPEKDFEGFEPPSPYIPESIGHHKEWIEAAKKGDPSLTTCNFDYSGALAETVLLGNVAYRTGKCLEWDAKALRAKNCPEADRYIRTPYREGWTL